MATRRPPRLVAACDQGFGRYFLTICTDRRRGWFAVDECVERIRSDFLRTLDDYAFDAIASCFMRDHLHALLESARVDCDLTRSASMFKQRSAFAHKTSTTERLWQAGYYDRVLRPDEDSLDVVAYILNNPVKAGYCREPRDSPHSGSTRYGIDE